VFLFPTREARLPRHRPPTLPPTHKQDVEPHFGAKKVPYGITELRSVSRYATHASRGPVYASDQSGSGPLLMQHTNRTRALSLYMRSRKHCFHHSPRPQNNMFRRCCSAHQHILCAEQHVPALLQRTSAHSLRRTTCSGAVAARISTFSAQNNTFRRSCSAHPHILCAEQHVPALLQRTLAPPGDTKKSNRRSILP
jgi:hypothetical protein